MTDDPRVSTNNPVFSRIEHPGVGEHIAAGPAARIADLVRGAVAPAPLLGEHTDAVLSELLGLSGEAIGKLHDTGIVAGPERDPTFSKSVLKSMASSKNSRQKASDVAQASRALDAATALFEQVRDKTSALCAQRISTRPRSTGTRSRRTAMPGWRPTSRF